MESRLMDFEHLTFEDHFAASAVASLGGGKRDRSEAFEDTECEFESTVKKISLAHENAGLYSGSLVPAPAPIDDLMYPREEMQNYPFYYYKDFSTEQDDDPLTPLTPPGRVPNFLAKMHAILSRRDLADIISWMPHGRAWRVLKPREFEVRVIPAYFEHSKFSSFIRQANGWGFRRITQGRDRNSYYHPLFLRGLPHLCKKIKRPGVAEKQAFNPDLEPDLYKISELFPVPEKAQDESIMLQSTIRGGPKARVPIYSVASPASKQKHVVGNMAGQMLTPSDLHALASFQQSLGASEKQLSKVSSSSAPAMMPAVFPSTNLAMPVPFQVPFNFNMDAAMSPLAIANQLAFPNPDMSSGSAASQFAAGFAAATALSQQQFQAMLATMQQQGLMPPQNDHFDLLPTDID